MVRSLCMGPVVVVLALTGLAWGQPEPASAPPKELRQAVITVQEPDRPNLKARVLATWFQADGSRAFQVQALTSGEMMTVVEVGPHTRTPGANGKFFQAVATRIYHWGGTVPPAGVPMPPENHPVVAFQPTPPVSSAPTGVQMVRPTVEPARRLASNGPASGVSNEKRVWPPAYGTCATCTQDPINPGRAQTMPQPSGEITPYARPSRTVVAQAPVPSQPIPAVRTTPTLSASVPQPAYPSVVTVKTVVATTGQTLDGGVVNSIHTDPVPLPVIGEEPSWPRGTLRKSPALVSQVVTPNCLCDNTSTPVSTSPPRMGQAPAMIQREIIQPTKSLQVRTPPQGVPAGSSQLVSQVVSPNCACDTTPTITTAPPVRVVRTPVIIQKEGIQPSQPVQMRTMTQRNQTGSGPLVSKVLSPKCECETVATTNMPSGHNSQMPVKTVNDQPSAPRVVYAPVPPIINAPGPNTTTAGLASQGVPPGLIPTNPASQPGNLTKSPYAVVDASADKPKKTWTGGLLPHVFGWKDDAKTTANGTASGSTVVSRVTEPVRPANSSVGQPTSTDVNGRKNIWGNTPIVQTPLSPPVKPTQVGSINPSMSTGPLVAGQQSYPMLQRLDPPAIQTQTASSLTMPTPTGLSNPATPTTPAVAKPQNSTLLARLDPPPGSSLTAPKPNPAPPAVTPATPVKPTNAAPAKPPVQTNTQLVQGQTVIPFADKSKPDPLEDLGSYTKIPGLEGKLTTPKLNAASDTSYRVKGNQSSQGTTASGVSPVNQASPAALNGSVKPAGPTTPPVKPVNPVTPVTPIAPVTPVAPITPVTPVAPSPRNPVNAPVKPATPPAAVTRTAAVVPAANGATGTVPPAPPRRAPASAPLPQGNASLAMSAPSGRQSIMAAQAAAQQVTNESRHAPGAVAPISVSALEGNAFSSPGAPQGSPQPAQAPILQRTAGTAGPAPGYPLPPGGPMMPYGPPAMGPYQGPAALMMGMQPPPISPVRCPIPTGYTNAFTQAGNPNPIPADANSDSSNTDNAFQSIQGATLPVPVQVFNNVPSSFPASDVPVSPSMESGVTVDSNLAAARGHQRDSLASKPSNGGIVPVSAQAPVPGPTDDVGNPVSLPELLAILNDSLYPSQREVAAENLCSFDWRVHPQVAEVLLHAAQTDPAPMVRIACIHALVKQKASTTYCVQALQSIKTSDKNEQVRKEAETALRTLIPTGVPSSTDRSATR